MFSIPLEPIFVKPIRGVISRPFSSVSTSGQVQNFACGKNCTILQIYIKHITGSGSYTLQVFTDSLLQEKIFEFYSDESPMIINKLSLEFQNSETPISNSCYIKITPSLGFGHEFIAKLFFNKM